MSVANTQPAPDMIEFHRLVDEIRRRMTTWEMRALAAEARANGLVAAVAEIKAELARVTAQRDRLLNLSRHLLPHVEV